MSSTTYKSILLAQPADGDVVFVRRWTRDPPLLATWIDNMRAFITSPTLKLKIDGSTLDGTYTLNFNVSIPIFSIPGWFNITGGNNFIFAPLTTGLFTLAALSNTPGGFWIKPTNFTGIWPSGEDPVDFATNPFGTADRMGLLPTDPTGLWLPAAAVSAWRPQ